MKQQQYRPPPVMGYQLDPQVPLHKLAVHRMRLGRDLKIIITAEDSETGVGKTTCGGFLGISWTRLFAGHEWFVEPDEYGIGMGTVNPREYFSMIGKIGGPYNAGTAVIVDDAEELDARRSMQNLNVKFSQRWMLMRLKQAITIITLPSPSSIDSRIEELADVWINVKRRGMGLVHDIRVQSYGGRNVMTKQVHELEFPDVSDHPELQKLEDMKVAKMDTWDTEEDEEQEEIDPDEISKEEKREIAQRLRNQGVPIESQKPERPDIASAIDMSQSWISKNTQPPE